MVMRTGGRYRYDRIGNVIPDRRRVESHTEETRTRKTRNYTVGVVRFTRPGSFDRERYARTPFAKGRV